MAARTGAQVRNAMNEINAAQRLREATKDKAEADKLLVVKAAEAESESKVSGYVLGGGRHGRPLSLLGMRLVVVGGGRGGWYPRECSSIAQDSGAALTCLTGSVRCARSTWQAWVSRGSARPSSTGSRTRWCRSARRYPAPHHRR